MEEDLRPVPIQELRLAPDHGRQWTLDHHLPQLDSLTKVRGQVLAEHLGSALQVRGEAETIVTLCCRPVPAALQPCSALRGEGTHLAGQRPQRTRPQRPR